MRSLIRLIRSTLRHPLNRTSAYQRILALGRVIRWQLASRLLPEAAIALPFVRGTSLITNRGMFGATGNWYNGLDEPEEMGLLLHLLQPGDVFVDIGANIGSFTILAASTGGVKCVAFEPIPRTFNLLARNVAFNAVGDHVSLRQQGLSDSSGSLHFTTALDSMNHVVPGKIQDARDSITVDVIRLDDARLPQPEKFIIFKIDVEGFELPVLKGGIETLRSPKAMCVVMETNGSGERYGVSDSELIDLMRQYGYRPYSYSPFTRSFDLIESIGTHINTIFLKDLDEASRRVKEASSVQLLNGPL